MKIQLFLFSIPVVALAAGCCVCHCGPDHGVHVFDAHTRLPIEGAPVAVIFPSGASTTVKTDKQGMAYFKDGFGPVEDGVHLEVTTPGQLTMLSLSAASHPIEAPINPIKP